MIETVKNKGLALLILAGAQFMVVLDATIVNVALPSIQKALVFTSTAQLQWIVTAYTLLFGGFLLLGGRLSDLMGRRKVFLIGIILFAIASLLAGFAQNPTQIIAFRGLQGLGAALLSPAALSLVLSIFAEGAERNKALGVWSGVAAGGGAVGLLLGGVLTQFVDWRWIFFINVPVAAVLVFLALRNLPQSAPAAGSRSLDLPGAVLVTSGLMVLVYSFVKATEYGWASIETLGGIALAVALLVGFIINELHVAHPLMPLRIFKNRNVTAGNLMQLPITAGMFSVFFYLSLYLQQILEYSPVKTGVHNLPFTFFIALTATIASKKVAQVSPKKILIFAPLLTAAGLAYFARIPVSGNYLVDVLPGIAMMASGMGATFVALTLAATSGVEAKESGLVSGLLNTSQQIGGAIGLAVLTTISTAKTNSVMAAAGGNPAALNGALVQGFRSAFMIASLLAIAASVIALIGLQNHTLTKDELDHEMEHEAEGFPVVPGV
ncbi:MAG TPA: MFS transporter [Candidatus Saccharimonadales bacterium]|jgi:EmrB/QacA subfamily drug resistance transporter